MITRDRCEFFMRPRLIHSKGHAQILGVHVEDEGVNIAVVSAHAQHIYFCLYDEAGENELFRTALPHRLGDIHYGFVEGISIGAKYGLRAHGPWQDELGHRFDLSKLLIDPYARQIDRPFHFDPALTQFGQETAALVPKCIITPPPHRREPHSPSKPNFIYELQVKSFTHLHPSVPAEHRGHVSALKEPVILDYLSDLGVDCVELMPLAAWIDERHLPPLGLSNAWGYNPISFMAPDPRLAPGGFEEIRQAVAALQARSIKVILDVVFNHTGESDLHGATVSLRGLDHALYYRHHQGVLINDTGCGNTLALENGPVIRLVLDSLRIWAQMTGLDGFRFDLAAIMGRTSDGFSAQSAVLAAIEQDDILSKLIMIAEPWDIGPGGYQLGAFPARWHEWNDRYRDDMRSFWGRCGASLGSLATRLVGSPDVFDHYRSAQTSINFLSAHDGFTLKDLTLYAHKHNHANGEENRDGKSDEQTCPNVDVRFLLSILFFSIGTPMLTAGDEFGRTQLGNNNAYCQDNELTWLDWSQADSNLIAYVRELAHLRKSYPHFSRRNFVTGTIAEGPLFPDCQWLSLNGQSVNWDHPDEKGFICIMSHEDVRLALVIHRASHSAEVNLPLRQSHHWVRVHSISTPQLGDHFSVYEERRQQNKGLLDEEWRELARSSGIAPTWRDLEGRDHHVPLESLRHILSSMQIDPTHPMPEDETALSAPLIGPAHQPLALNALSAYRQEMTLRGENGFIYESFCALGDIITQKLEPGYYQLFYNGSDRPARQVLIHPQSCFLPPALQQGHKLTAFASHLYCLRHSSSDHSKGEGMGDFQTLRRLADHVHHTQQGLVGLNPLHHLFVNDRRRISPYQPSDRRFIDPIYINIADLLVEFDLPHTREQLSECESAFSHLESLRLIDYSEVWRLKCRLLETAYSEFTSYTDFESYLHRNHALLEKHCLFEVQAAHEDPSEERLRYRAFLQWLCERQLSAAAQHHNLYRDLALGCAYDGGEVQAYSDLFLQNISIGAPPDSFSREGQIWHLPPQSPLRMRQSGFQHFRTLLEHNMRHSAALRIDHVLGLARQYWIPDGAPAMSGAYVQFPLQALLALLAIESHRHSCLVIGEDLGILPEGLRGALDQFDILSTRLALFEKQNGAYTPASHYPHKAMVSLGSHDSPTFTGWRAGSDLRIAADLGHISSAELSDLQEHRRHEIAQFDQAAQIAQNDATECLAQAHGFLAQTPAMICALQIDDLLAEADQLNVPGTDQQWPNWRRRLTHSIEEAFEGEPGRTIVARVKNYRP
ncbi:MAG: glycogen debranching enzyme GlgX [Alphaproteobacteria bacterium]|nr:glycogen debranching enzyme GlgX [Alphaproteobacteria bacterium]